MTLAGVTVRRGDAGPTPVPLDDVSTRFEAVICQRGAVGVPIAAQTWSQLRDLVGDHTAYSTLRACESHFAEGGARVVVSRVVGPAARAATLELRDGVAATVLTITAQAPGDWYHAIRATVTRGTGDERVITLRLGETTLASGTCADEQEAQDLIDAAGFVSAAIGAGTWPIVEISDQALAGGDDDRASITDTEVSAALDAFDESEGPGSICASGWTTVAVHTALAQHAAERNRFARADLPDIASAGTLVAHAAQIRALDEAPHIQLLAGWPEVDVAGVTVAVPPSGVHTGREARTDREHGPGPGQPCAWTFGEYATPVGVSRSWSRSDREVMADAGITIVVQDQGAIFAEDAITPVDPARHPQYAEVSAMRVTMAIHNECKAILRQRVRSTIDGQGRIAESTAGDLIAICSRWYRRDALYGDAPSGAFAVQVTADPRARALTGNLQLRPSPSVQTVDLTITQIAAANTIEGS